MAIWMDMTNSLRTWQGGVVGIIRTELELARGMKKKMDALRIVVCNGKGFEEVPAHELNWLWDADSVADAYAARTGGNARFLSKKVEASTQTQEEKLPAGLRRAYAYSTSRRERLLRAIWLWADGHNAFIGGITKGLLAFPIRPVIKVGSWFVRKLKKRQPEPVNAESAEENLESNPLTHPFREGDVVFSCGWYSSNKEKLFSRLKSEMGHLELVYMVYDIILILEGLTQFYDKKDTDDFRRYFEWISINCDCLMYCGRTAKDDAEKYQIENGFHTLPGYPLRFGADIKKTKSLLSRDEVCRRFDIRGDYMLAVGSLEPRKNYVTLYKAMKILREEGRLEEAPMLVIVGGISSVSIGDLFKKDPDISGRVRLIRPDDDELETLYRNSKFLLLPSLYEGGSVVLLETLNYNKFCLTSDVPPLHDVGENFVEYINPHDPTAWAEAILRYTTDGNLLAEKEKFITDNWIPALWQDCSDKALDVLLRRQEAAKEAVGRPTIYYDLTLTHALSVNSAPVSGILRAQLLLARYLGRILRDMKFCILEEDQHTLVDRWKISMILGSANAERAFAELPPLKKNKPGLESMSAKSKESTWLFISVLPGGVRNRLIRMRERRRGPINTEAAAKRSFDVNNSPLKRNDLVFSTGVGYSPLVYESLLHAKSAIGFSFIQLMYDYTPIIMPQTHTQETIRAFPQFLDHSNLLSDHLFYGGETAMKDGEAYQKERGQTVRDAFPVRFGSDGVISDVIDPKKYAAELKAMGIKGDFILCVGTLQLRKNHGLLYDAYVRMLEDKLCEQPPQMVFAGYPGWKTEDLVAAIRRDKRVEEKILIFTPTDAQLDMLYKNCRFLLLPSMYEGWSLTLPEGLNYGKFTIAADVEPLREIGREFVEFISPWDTVQWAERIAYYSQNDEALAAWEKKIKEEWHSITWLECAENIAQKMTEIVNSHDAGGNVREKA